MLDKTLAIANAAIAGQWIYKLAVGDLHGWAFAAGAGAMAAIAFGLMLRAILKEVR